MRFVTYSIRGVVTKNLRRIFDKQPIHFSSVEKLRCVHDCMRVNEVVGLAQVQNVLKKKGPIT